MDAFGNSSRAFAEPGALPIGKAPPNYQNPADTLSVLFGQPKYPINPADLATTRTLPEAYKGKNSYIAQQIEEMVFQEGNWHLQRLMPILEFTAGMTVTFSTTTFDPHLAADVPEGGTVMLVDSQRIESTSAFARRGLGYRMQHGYLYTEQGFQDHFYHLRQIAQSCLETAKFDVIFTLLEGNREAVRRELATMPHENKRLEEALKDEKWMWAAFQKHRTPIQSVVSHIGERMARYGGMTDTIIIPEPAIRYLQNVPEAYTTYKEAGPVGPAILFDRQEPFSMMSGKVVHVSRTYYADRVLGRRELLSRDSSIGEYYLFKDRHISDCKNYCSREREGKIYSEPADNFGRLNFLQLLDESGLFKEDDTPIYLQDELRHPSGLTGDQAMNDLFNYYDGESGQYYNVTMMGEFNHQYVTPDDKLRYADVVFARLHENMGDTAFNELMMKWNRGMQLIEKISNKDYSEAQFNSFMASIGQIDDSMIDRANDVYQTEQFKQDPETGFMSPNVLTETPAGIQSYAGLRWLVASADMSVTAATAAGTAMAPGPQRDAKIARDFLSVFEIVVDNLKTFQYRPRALDKNFASSWWNQPTDYHTAFEELLIPYTVPLFVRIGDEGAEASGTNRLLQQIDQTSSYPLNENATKNRLRDFIFVLRALVGRMAKVADQEDIVNLVRAQINGRTEDAIKRSALEAIREARETNAEIYAYQDDEIVSHLNAIQNEFEKRSNSGDAAGGRYVRTPLLVSSHAMSSFVGQTDFLPADPHLPSFPVDPVILDDATRGSPYRTDVSIEARMQAAKFADEFHPAFSAGSINEMQSIRETNFVNNARANQFAHSIGAGHGFDRAIENLDRDFIAAATQSIGGLRESALTMPKRPMSAMDTELHRHLAHSLSPTYEASYNMIAKNASSSLHRAIAHSYDSQPLNKQVFVKAYRYNLPMHISLCAVRLNMLYTMLCMIQCLAGDRMGVTIVRPGEFEIQDDGLTHMQTGTFMFYSKAVIKDHRMHFIAQDIMANGYISGTDLTFIDPNTYAGGRGEHMSGSIMVIPLGYNTQVGQGLFSAIGSMVVHDYSDFHVVGGDELEYETMARSCQRWGFLAGRKRGEFDINSDKLGSNVRTNVLAYPGHVMLYDSRSGDFTMEQPGTGHWGPRGTYVGVAALRDGRDERMPMGN